jgi:hypothetical protein
MAKQSIKKMGKEVGPASLYAKPHTMSGKTVRAEPNPSFGPNLSKMNDLDMSVGAYSRSAGNEPTKTSGIVTRGNGCATRGITARGPMA